LKQFNLPNNYMVLLCKFNSTKHSFNLLIYPIKKEIDKLSPVHRGKVTFTYENKIFRPYKFEQISGNSYHFLKPKLLESILYNSNLNLILSYDKPNNLDDYLQYFSKKKLAPPKSMSVCIICLSDTLKLTRLHEHNTYYSYRKTICLSCATEEIQEEYKKRGIPITKSAYNYYTKLLRKVKSINSVTENIWNPLNSINDPKRTMFDVIPADTNLSKIPLHTMQNNKVNTPSISKMINLYSKIGINSLLPLQKLAIDNGLFDNKNLLIIAGTSAGKTFVAELAGIKNWLDTKRKFIFLTPLVALSNQKYELFKNRYSSIGAKVTLRVGMSKIDDESKSIKGLNRNFLNGDIIVATYEALDWILRSGTWKNMGEVGTIVIDEFQLLSDPERGPELDGIIARCKSLYQDAQIIGLSATIGNPKEISNAFDFELLEYMDRPIPLERHLIMPNNETERIEIIKNLVLNEIKNVSSKGHKGQSLIFTNSRVRVQELSSLLKTTGLKISHYHAGLTYSQRKTVEENFESGLIDAVTTTAALGAGADFPVSQVIFEKPAMGARWITNAEYHQMSGRAGRFGMHDRGKSILISTPGERIYSSQIKTEEQISFELLTGNIEPIDGAVDLETEADQLLAFVSSKNPVSYNQIEQYYDLLFYNSGKLNSIISSLIKKGLIILDSEKWFITPLGRSITSSFLNPTFGYQIALKTKNFDVKDIACEISPINSVHIYRSIHSRLEQSMKTHLSTRFLSDSILDIITGNVKINKLQTNIVSKIKTWNKLFFDCKCKENPYCIHPQLKLSKLILNMRLDGLKIYQIIDLLTKKYGLFVYTGDLYSWFDELIHATRSISRIASALQQQKIKSNSDALALKIEKS